jgi:nucleotide-binding universal stress UspA family protein/RimJ/RimL family protein N-acetyltransferase
MATRSRGRTVTLRDGARVRLRPIAPEDRALLAASFERLSEQSRYRRFLTAKSKLSSTELDYLLDVDHSDHEAIVAIEPATGAMLGIARYVRAKEDPQLAEVAVTVADDWQRRGVGRALLDRLTYRARREGIRRFNALVLSENRPALGLLEDVGETRRRRSAGELELLIELPPSRGMGAQLGRALRAAGAGGLVPARTLAQRVAAGSTHPLHPSRPIRTIVVGVGAEEHGARVLAVAVELAAVSEGSLHLVRAYNDRRELSDSEAVLAAAGDAARLAGLAAVVHALRDDPADALVAVADEEDADLVIVGGTGMSGGKRLLAGSVSNRVSHRAPCSVLIVRGEPTPARAAG